MVGYVDMSWVHSPPLKDNVNTSDWICCRENAITAVCLVTLWIHTMRELLELEGLLRSGGYRELSVGVPRL
jgi:hypothetical protein